MEPSTCVIHQLQPSVRISLKPYRFDTATANHCEHFSGAIHRCDTATKPLCEVFSGAMHLCYTAITALCEDLSEALQL